MKAAKDLQSGAASSASSSSSSRVSVELLEKQIAAVADYLQITIQDTKRNVEKKQSMTIDEIMAGIEAAETGADVSSHPYYDDEW